MQLFRHIHIMKIPDLIINHEHILAHLSEDGRTETLQEHSELCIQYLEKILDRKQLYPVLQNVESHLLSDMSVEGKEVFWEMFYHTISLHDMGKINCNFQYFKMNNTFFKDNYSIDCNTTNHSMLSAIIYINEFYMKIAEVQFKKDCPKLNAFMFLNAYIISKHHGNFDSFEEFQNRLIGLDGEGKRLILEQKILYNNIYAQVILKNNLEILRKLFTNALQTLKELETSSKELSIDIFIYERFLASLLLACDYYATTEFKNQKAINYFGEINNICEFMNIFRSTDLYQSIKYYEENEYGKRKDFEEITDINILRNEMFLDAEKVLCNNLGKNIFFLEAPTGSGKSMVSFNLGFTLLDKDTNLNKIYYVYPFNTLIEQNIDNINKIFGNSECMKNIAVINSVNPMNKIMEDDEEGDVINQNIDYVRTLLDRQFLHYPIILTTHVSMFHYLFGTNKEALFPLAQIANSVIILDEIQSYRNEIWKEIITFLNHYSKMLNIKIIIMSATLPNLSRLVDTDIKIVNLITDHNKYYLNSIFKDRVKHDFSLIDVHDDVMEYLIHHIINTGQQENINILIEFIYRKSAYEAYERLKGANIHGKEIMLLTGDDTSFERKSIVQAFKERKDIILVATQVIEAGVDIDADIGYKDISLLDSEEQFIGRVNRNFKNRDKKGMVYFFHMDSAATLYKQDVRKEKMLTLENVEIRNILLNKNFELYYQKVLDAIKNNDYRFEEFIKNAVNTLNFKDIEDKMRLIDNDRYEYSIFLSRIIPVSDTAILDGQVVWNEYIKILEDENMDYSIKKVKLFDARTKLNYFIYKTSNNNFKYEKRIGDLYYISEIEEYFIDGKFIRSSLDKDMFI